MDEARRDAVPGPLRGRLAPFRDVLLLQRAKGLSYEQIAAVFERHGLKISPAAVGVFCRRAFSQSEIALARRKLTMAPGPIVAGQIPASAPVAPAGNSTSSPAVITPRPRGPKIARDNY
jgi:hypothetical protein